MEDKVYRILTINPGSTSTKVGVYENSTKVTEDVVRHPKDVLSRYDTVVEQKDMRIQVVQELIEKHQLDLSTFDAIVGRGGLTKPLDGGTYIINNHMLEDLSKSALTQHASALGGIIAHELGTKYNLPNFVVDPVVVDEMDPRAKYAGLPGIERRSVFHALNQKAVARRCAKDMGKQYEECRFIVAHMGGGITVGAHRYGRVIDVNDGLDGEGPFSPERAGGLPVGQLVRMCYSGMYSEKELMDLITRKGGLMAYLGTNDLREAERLIKEGNTHAARVLEAMAYQVSKEIGAMAAVLEGRIDAIVLTGGLAYSARFVSWIRECVSFLAPVKVYPGEDEMRALAEGAVRVLSGQESAAVYQ